MLLHKLVRTQGSLHRLVRHQSGQVGARTLVQLDNVKLPHPAPSACPSVTLRIQDGQAWAVVGGEGDGERTREALRDVILGRSRPKTQDGSLAANPLPFLQGASSGHHIHHLAFGARAAAGGAFVDYAVRYGAIRGDEDAVTLYESTMDKLGHPTGLLAKLSCRFDVFLPSPPGAPGAPTQAEREAAKQAHTRIMSAARMLDLDRPPPAEDVGGGDVERVLLHTPLLRLSNGQMRRGRLLEGILRCRSEEEEGPGHLLVLTQPYNGLDARTRALVSKVLEQLHKAKAPRILLFLRTQDTIPEFITHVARVHEDGSVECGEKQDVSIASDSQFGEQEGGYEVVKSNAAAGIGRGDAEGEELVKLTGVDVLYGGNKALDTIDLSIRPGARLVLVGDNGSGKTTLLSLLLGDHPQSFSIPSSALRLFGKSRDAPSNATTILARRIGHVSPELYNSFPRKDADRGGLTTLEAIGSGFEGIFSRRARSEAEKERSWRLLALFHDVIRAPDGAALSSPSSAAASNGEQNSKAAYEAAKALGKVSFSSLSPGSQSVVLLLRAIVGSPPLLILDEPFQHMDRRQVERARAFLNAAGSEDDAFAVGASEADKMADLEKRKSMALVLVSHYEREWLSNCGELLRLEAGKVVERI